MDLAPRRHNTYSEEEIERGLMVVALCAGNSRRACKMLAGRGYAIPRATLEYWKSSRADRYQEIRDQQLPIIRRKLAEEAEDIARELAALERQAMRQLGRRMADIKPAEIGSTLRNLTTSKGINMDKANVIRELPTEIVQHRKTSDDLIDELRAMGLVVDGTGEEIKAAEVVVERDDEDTPPELPRAA